MDEPYKYSNYLLVPRPHLIQLPATLLLHRPGFPQLVNIRKEPTLRILNHAALNPFFIIALVPQLIHIVDLYTLVKLLEFP